MGTVPCGCDGADDGDAAFPFQGAAAGERLCGVRVHTPTIGDVAGRSSLPALQRGSRTRMSHCSRVFRPAGSRDRASPPPLTPPTIDQTCRNHQARRALGYRSVTSVDGTRLRAWDNDGHGVARADLQRARHSAPCLAGHQPPHRHLPGDDVGPSRSRRIGTPLRRVADQHFGPHRRPFRGDGLLRRGPGGGHRMVGRRQRRV